MVVQLYPRTLGIHFIRLLRHAWTTLGLLLFPVTTWEVSIKAWKNILFLASSLWQICSEWLLCALHCPLRNVASLQKFWSMLDWSQGVTLIVWLCLPPQTVTFPARTRAVMLASNEYSSSLYDFSAPELAYLYFVSTTKGKAIPVQAWTGCEGSRRLRHIKVLRPPLPPTPKKYSWCSFLLKG
jgi:hypothetical protein